MSGDDRTTPLVDAICWRQARAMTEKMLGAEDFLNDPLGGGVSGLQRPKKLLAGKRWRLTPPPVSIPFKMSSSNEGGLEVRGFFPKKGCWLDTN